MRLPGSCLGSFRQVSEVQHRNGGVHQGHNRIDLVVFYQGNCTKGKAASAQSFIGHADCVSAMACCGDHIISASDVILVWKLNPSIPHGSQRRRQSAQSWSHLKSLQPDPGNAVALIQSATVTPESLHEAQVSQPSHSEHFETCPFIEQC